MRDSVEDSNAFEMSTAMAMVLLASARGLALVEVRDHPSRDGEQGRGSGMPRFEAVLGGASAHRLHDGREDEPIQYLHCWVEQ